MEVALGRVKPLWEEPAMQGRKPQVKDMTARVEPANQLAAVVVVPVLADRGPPVAKEPPLL